MPAYFSVLLQKHDTAARWYLHHARTEPRWHYCVSRQLLHGQIKSTTGSTLHTGGVTEGRRPSLLLPACLRFRAFRLPLLARCSHRAPSFGWLGVVCASWNPLSQQAGLCRACHYLCRCAVRWCCSRQANTRTRGRVYTLPAFCILPTPVSRLPGRAACQRHQLPAHRFYQHVLQRTHPACKRWASDCCVERMTACTPARTHTHAAHFGRITGRAGDLRASA